ncbi:MAG: hypothetical protein IT307_08490 [Chloroflexi bacterium]|nr:hypothetical protein [Chloroflexota bacterium]
MPMVTVHWLALGLSLVLSMALVAGTGSAGAQEAEIPWSAIGFSQGGLPLVVKRLGTGPGQVLIMGGQHGGPEYNTVQLVEQLLASYASHPEEIPSTVTLNFLTEANPDGVAGGTRLFLSGVDPNRNWATPDWQTNAWDSNGVFIRGLAGSQPFSEQETRALRDWVLDKRPVFLVNYHSAGGFLFDTRTGLGNDLADAYADGSGYWRPAQGGGGVLGYRATGSMGGWLREREITSMFIELTSAYNPEVERNLSGLRAALAVLDAALVQRTTN